MILFAVSIPRSLLPPSCDNADSLEVLAWFAGGLTPVLDTLWLWKTSTIMRNQGSAGVATDWILAMIQLGLLAGIAAKQSEENKIQFMDMTQKVFAVFPGLFKFFRLPPINRWQPGLGALALLDGVGDFGAGAA